MTTLRDIVSELIKAYEKNNCNMSLTLHFLHSHLECSLQTSPSWGRDTQRSGTLKCLRNIVETWKEILQKMSKNENVQKVILMW